MTTTTKATRKPATKSNSNTATLDQLAKQLEGPKATKTRSRYEEQKAQGVVNPIVLADLMGVRAQMIYNYIRKGRFSEVPGAADVNSTQKRTLHIGEANTFAKQYSERKEAKAAKVAAELEGNTEEVTESE